MADEAAKPDAEGLVSWAWSVIANAGGGDWDNETQEWRLAARRWEKAWNAYRSSAADVVAEQLMRDARKERRQVPLSPDAITDEHVRRFCRVFYGTEVAPGYHRAVRWAMEAAFAETA